MVPTREVEKKKIMGLTRGMVIGVQAAVVIETETEKRGVNDTREMVVTVVPVVVMTTTRMMVVRH